MTFARWIDLGAPIDIAATRGNPGLGWFLDDQRPALTVSSPRPNYNSVAPRVIRIGMADANSGIDLASFRVSATFPVQGRNAGSPLADLATQTTPGVFEIDISNTPLANLHDAHVRAEVADKQGNVKRVDVRFSTALDGTIFSDSFEL